MVEETRLPSEYYGHIYLSNAGIFLPQTTTIAGKGIY